jgi:molybdenum cofactor cytidylyltransferase
MPADRAIIDCIVPAAGRSSRMGAWKPGLPFGSSTVVQTVVSAALAVCSRVIVVGGYRAADLVELFAGAPSVLFVENPDWELGMFSSLRTAAARVETERFFITPGDMPWIEPDVYRALLAAPRAEVVFPTFADRKGHPVLLSAAVASAMRAADPARGIMREIIGRFPTTRMVWSDDTIMRDADTPQDLR